MRRKQEVNSTKIPSHNRTKRNVVKYIPLLSIVFGMSLTLYGGYSFLGSYRATHGVAKLPAVNNIVTKSTKVPDEKMPDINEPYDVSAYNPRRIIIDTIGVNAFIQQVSLDENNAIAVPSNVHIAGWYINTPKPGDDGLSIIDGHVSGKYNDGIFKDLRLAKAHTKFTIEFGDLSKRTFEIIQIIQIPESQAADFLLKHDETITAQLNLITCGGKFNKNTATFDDRIIVVAKRVDK